MEIKPLPTHILNNDRVVVPVICPTRDYQGAVAQSIVTIWNALWIMGREPAYVQSGAHGYAFVRSGAFKQLHKAFKKDVIRGLMIDDDILITEQQGLHDAILMADRWGWNFVSPYRVKDGGVTIWNGDADRLSTQEEYKKYQPWDFVDNAGLGFYYGDIPVTYQFHEGGKYGGEDLNFFADNPTLKPRFLDLGLVHIKAVPLRLDTKIDHKPIPGEVQEAA